LAHEEPSGEGHGVTINGVCNDPPGHAKLQERPADHPVLVVQARHSPRFYSKAYPFYYQAGRCTRRLRRRPGPGGLSLKGLKGIIRF